MLHLESPQEIKYMTFFYGLRRSCIIYDGLSLFGKEYTYEVQSSDEARHPGNKGASRDILKIGHDGDVTSYP